MGDATLAPGLRKTCLACDQNFNITTDRFVHVRSKLQPRFEGNTNHVPNFANRNVLHCCYCNEPCSSESRSDRQGDRKARPPPDIPERDPFPLWFSSELFHILTGKCKNPLVSRLMKHVLDEATVSNLLAEYSPNGKLKIQPLSKPVFQYEELPPHEDDYFTNVQYVLQHDSQLTDFADFKMEKDGNFATRKENNLRIVKGRLKAGSSVQVFKITQTMYAPNQTDFIPLGQLVLRIKKNCFLSEQSATTDNILLKLVNDVLGLLLYKAASELGVQIQQYDFSQQKVVDLVCHTEVCTEKHVSFYMTSVANVPTLKNVSLHHLKKLRSVIELVACPIQESAFSVWENLGLEVEFGVELTGVHQCPQCPQVFPKKSNLTRHCDTQHKPKSNRWQCCFCCRTFARIDGLRRHRRTAKICGAFENKKELITKSFSELARSDRANETSQFPGTRGLGERPSINAKNHTDALQAGNPIEQKDRTVDLTDWAGLFPQEELDTLAAKMALDAKMDVIATSETDAQRSFEEIQVNDKLMKDVANCYQARGSYIILLKPRSDLKAEDHALYQQVVCMLQSSDGPLGSLENDYGEPLCLPVGQLVITVKEDLSEDTDSQIEYFESLMRSMIQAVADVQETRIKNDHEEWLIRFTRAIGPTQARFYACPKHGLEDSERQAIQDVIQFVASEPDEECYEQVANHFEVEISFGIPRQSSAYATISVSDSTAGDGYIDISAQGEAESSI